MMGVVLQGDKSLQIRVILWLERKHFCFECIFCVLFEYQFDVVVFFSPLQAAVASGTLRAGRRRLSDSSSPSPAPNTLLMSVTGKVTQF